MTKAFLWGSDIFTAIQTMRSDDLGKTWNEPMPEPTLDRRQFSDGVESCPCDMTPACHQSTGKLLMIGHTANYYQGEKGALITDGSHTIDIAYSVYDDIHRKWSEWAVLELPDRKHFYLASAGCSQRVDLRNGDILLPIYCLQQERIKGDYNKAEFFVTVAKCAFDGQTLRYLEHGNEMSVNSGRGLCEPSLTYYKGMFYLTIRNDFQGYVATSRDGLHFSDPVIWTFDDGQELGSYNTQQHWITHSDGLFLVYTRRGADNDYVFRHRAPLFMSEVDPERLCLIRGTEREIIPNYGAQLGNFGAMNASPYESWAVTSEDMQGDAENPYDIARTERRGANNRVYIGRIVWDKPNDFSRLAP